LCSEDTGLFSESVLEYIQYWYMTMDMIVSKSRLLWLQTRKSPCYTDGLRDEAWKKEAKMLVAEVMN